jgi:SagB-type dehydrogenase family enzyme
MGLSVNKRRWPYTRRYLMKSIKEYREFLKAHYWRNINNLDLDRLKGIPSPEVQKPYPEDAELIELVAIEDIRLGEVSLKQVIGQRRSRRKFTDRPLSIEELSYLLWATQGISGDKPRLRCVPSAGGRHPFETYLFINRVTGIEQGLYRYLPLEHRLVLVRRDERLMENLVHACCEQGFVGEGAVMFVWAVIPYRSEWNYNVIAHKMIAIDAGHVCGNLYLAAESIGAGVCGIGKYDQQDMDRLLGVDGEDEYAIYGGVLGKIE